MTEISFAPHRATDAPPQITEAPQLRGPDLTVARFADAGYGTSPTKPKPLPPRPAQPTAQPTRKPLARERGWDLVRTGRAESIGSAA